MRRACGSELPGYPPCFLPEGHEGDHQHPDGRCQVGLKTHLTTYYANDPTQGVRWLQCGLLNGHDGPHKAVQEIKREVSF
jgi:hypothetical protein